MNKKLLSLSSQMLLSTLMLSSAAMAASGPSSTSTVSISQAPTEKYPTLKALCAASLKMHKPFLNISEIIADAYEEIDTQLDCRSQKLGIRVQRKIFEEVPAGNGTYNRVVKAKQNIAITGVKLLQGTENNLTTFDLIVKTTETQMVQNGYLTLDAKGQPMFGDDNFNGFINPSNSVSGDPAKDYGVYYLESEKSMESVCNLLPVPDYSETNDLICQKPIVARTQVIRNDVQFLTPAYYLSALATHLPGNRDLVGSRVDFQKSLSELSVLAEEISTQPIAEVDAQAAISEAQSKIAAQYEKDFGDF